MHAAKLDDSPRLQRVLAFLRERGKAGATGAEFFIHAGAMNPGTTASELKANGHPCVCKYERTAESGARIYRYTLQESLDENAATSVHPEPEAPVRVLEVSASGEPSREGMDTR